MSVYLDYNATAPLRPEVLDLVSTIMGTVGNASSVHDFGREARKHIEHARDQVAALCHVNADQVIFTSGATESINTVLHAYHDNPVLISAIEHPAVIAAAPQAMQIPVTADGIVDMTAYEELLKSHKPALVAVMLVNSETGVIQPIRALSDKAHDAGALFLCDAVQGAGRLDINFNKLGVDFMALSAHKFAGPQGVGALIKRNNLNLPPFMRGGGQEKNCRAGTHNTAGIAGMGLAAELALKHLKSYESIQQMRDQLETDIRALTNKAIIYGGNVQRVGNTTNIGLPGMPAQTQLMALDLDGVAVSSGSACSSGAFKPSHVLTATGASEEEAKSALRISMGWNTKQSDIDKFLESYKKIIERIK